MARDYKPRPKKNKRKTKRRKSDSGPIIWESLGLGVALGLTIGLIVYLFQNKLGNETPQQTQTLAETTTTTKKAVKTQQPKKEETESRFDFYTLLPQMEVVVRDEDIKEHQLPKKDPDATYILQVASFRSIEDAESLKANLALLGYQAQIHTAAINTEDAWHRVRIGPFKSLRKLDSIRSRLRKQNHNPIILKISNE